MGFLSKLFGKKDDNNKTGGMEDYMQLVRVYFQASIAANVGIANLAALPDLRVFKTTLHVPTVNNKLGVGEKTACRKMLKEIYGTDDLFFKEIDQSIRKNCRKMQDVQTYLVQFQGFTQDLMMLMGNLMKFKLRLPSFFKNALYKMTDDHRGRNLHPPPFHPHLLHPCRLRFRQHDGHLVLPRLSSCPTSFQGRK